MTPEALATRMTAGRPLVDGAVTLDLDGCTIAIRSNSTPLLNRLGSYFAHALGTGPADFEVLALEGEADDFGLDFTDWKREPGKTGRKDAYVDLDGARAIRKVRTGMVFLQSDTARIAAGPCLENDNQVINFVNAQYMTWLQRRGALICHAAGLVIGGRCLGLAGFSGGGKSTLMLRMLDEDGTAFLTNDRLFVKDGEALGIPKLPRINPGTIVHNPTLSPILGEERRAELLALPPAELWELEEKYDVDVEARYGAGRIVPRAPLAAFLILNWRRGADEPCVLSRVDLAERPELLGAVMKSPGPFHQFADGSFLSDETALDPAPYLTALEGIAIWEAHGKVDFDAAARQCRVLMGEGEAT